MSEASRELRRAVKTAKAMASDGNDIHVTSGAPNILAHAIRYALVRWYGAT